MTVSLNIENDSELRNYIKECIKGQVLSIVREEVIEMAKNELERKLKGSDNKSFDSMVKNAIQEVVSRICYNELGINTWSDRFVEPIVSQKVASAIAGKNWDLMVDALAKEKVRSLIK